MATEYRSAFLISLIIQAVFFVPTAVVMSAEGLVSLLPLTMVTAMAAYWGAALVTILRRPKAPRGTDITFIRYCFVPIYGIAFLIWCAAWYQ